MIPRLYREEFSVFRLWLADDQKMGLTRKTKHLTRYDQFKQADVCWCALILIHLRRGYDQVRADLDSPKHLAQYKATKDAEDLPGLGMYYCVECAKWFESEYNRAAHIKGKNHKRRSGLAVCVDCRMRIETDGHVWELQNPSIARGTLHPKDRRGCCRIGNRQWQAIAGE